MGKRERVCSMSKFHRFFFPQLELHSGRWQDMSSENMSVKYDYQIKWTRCKTEKWPFIFQLCLQNRLANDVHEMQQVESE